MTDKVRKTLREYTKDELIEIVGICIDKPQDNLALIRAALSGNHRER